MNKCTEIFQNPSEIAWMTKVFLKVFCPVRPQVFFKGILPSQATSFFEGVLPSQATSLLKVFCPVRPQVQVEIVRWKLQEYLGSDNEVFRCLMTDKNVKQNFFFPEEFIAFISSILWWNFKWHNYHFSPCVITLPLYCYRLLESEWDNLVILILPALPSLNHV